MAEAINPEIQKIIDETTKQVGDLGLQQNSTNAAPSPYAKDFDFGSGGNDWGAPSVPKKSDSGYGTAATLGAGAGALARLRGVNVGDRFVSTDPNLFAPATTASTTPTPVDQSHPLDPHIEAARADLDNSRQLADAELRRVTGDPRATTAGYTQEQIDRLFAGGNRSTLDTSGRGRQGTYQNETSRLADVNSLNRENLGKAGLDPRVAISDAGPMVTLDNGLHVSPQTALELSRQQQENANENARLLARQNAAALTEKQQNLAMLENERANDQRRQSQAAIQSEADAARAARIKGYAGGAGKVALSAAGLAEAFPMAKKMYEDYNAKKPLDWTEAASLAGGLASGFGGVKTGVLGQLAQLPYAYKHRDEIARAMNMEDVMPDTMRTSLAPGEGKEPAFPLLQKP